MRVVREVGMSCLELWWWREKVQAEQQLVRNFVALLDSYHQDLHTSVSFQGAGQVQPQLVRKISTLIVIIL